MSVIREVKFHELEEGMIIRIGEKSDNLFNTYFVENVVNVQQHDKPIAVQFRNTFTKYSEDIDEGSFTTAKTYLVGAKNENGVEWFTPPTQQESIIEPDPTTHDSYIQAIVVDGRKMEAGLKFGVGEVTQIKKVLGTEKNAFVFLNKNGAVLGEFHVGGHSDLSIVYGFREMDKT